jgi:GNAT superfamily N-acetyltransferase
MSGLPVELRCLEGLDLPAATGVVARGMRDNPGHIAIFGEDPSRRLWRLDRFFDVVLAWMHAEGEVVGAWHAGELVGVLGMPPQNSCFPSLARRARMGLSLLPGARPRELRRGARWMWEWERRDPRERHQHLGPVAVDAPLQGRGIGSQLMQAFCARMDGAGTVAYLETDKPENVRFYERFGFETIDETVLYGVRNWFMLRRPASSARVGTSPEIDSL